LVGCKTTPPSVIRTGNTSTKTQQSELLKVAKRVEDDADSINRANNKIRAVLPNSVEVEIIDEKVKDLAAQVATLRAAVGSLKEKDEAEQLKAKADEKQIAALEQKVAKLETDQSAYQFWMYALMIAGGAVGLAVGGGVLWMGVSPKIATGIMVSSGIVLVLGITIPNYGIYIGAIGFVFAAVGMVVAVLQSRKKIRKDERVKEELVHSVQTALEHPVEDAYKIFKERHDDDVIAEVAKVKDKKNLAGISLDANGEPTLKKKTT